MKIAFVAQPFDAVLPPHQNSIGIWIHEVARRLAQSCDVVVYTRWNHFLSKEKYYDGVRYRFVNIVPDNKLLRLLKRFSGFYNTKRPLFASFLYYLVYILQVAKDLRLRQCDIVHIMNFSQFAPIIRAFNPKIKIVLNMRCEWLTQLDQSMIERRLSQVASIIGCSEYITEKIRGCFPQYANRCHTVYNGVDINYFVPPNSPEENKKNIDRQLLFVGRVSPEKGVHVLLNAFQKVVQHYPKVRLKIVGPSAACLHEFLVALSDDNKVTKLASFYDGNICSYSFSLQKQIQSLGIDNHVIFVGKVPYMDIIKHYQDADLLINPSFSESFGRSLIEAMACGVPVIATRVGGMAEIINGTKAGVLVKSDDSEALAATILHLIENEDLRRAMGKVARKRAVELFSWGRIVENLLDLYNNTCKDNGQ